MLDAHVRPEFAAFGNHLVFLARHRGRMRMDRSGVYIDGAVASLSSYTPWPESSTLPCSLPAVRLAPWSPCDWPARLREAGYGPAERLAYMQSTGSHGRGEESPEVSIEAARSASALREFAAVQAEGFATGVAEVDGWWAPFFAEQAARNGGDAEQTFYLARVGGTAAATTLVLRAQGVAGIYAVATRPAYRRRGLARALLDRARTDAMAQYGIDRVILQAVSGSYPEAYYAKLGFRCTHELAVWRTPAAP